MVRSVFKVVILCLLSLTVALNGSNTIATKDVQLDRTLSLISNISKVVHSLQQERGASCGYVSSKNFKFRIKLKQIISKSDEQIEELTYFVQDNSYALENFISKNHLDRLNSKLFELYNLRTKVLDADITFADTYSKYTQIIAFLLLEVSNISEDIQEEHLSNMLYQYVTLLMYKESIGQKRASLSALFSIDKFSQNIFEYYLTSDTQEKIYLQVFTHIASKDINDKLQQALKNKVCKQVKRFEDDAIKKLQKQSVNVDPLKWFEIVTRKINLIQNVEFKLFQNIKNYTKELFKSNKPLYTQTELEFIKKQSPIKYVYDPNWEPFEYKDAIEQHKGIVADILKLVQTKSGLHFVSIPTDSWQQSLDYVQKEHKANMFSAVNETKERDKYLNFTKNALYSYKTVVLSKEEDMTNYANIEQSCKGKKVGVIQGYTLRNYLEKRYPSLNLIGVKDVDDGLKKMKKGEIDLFVVNIITAKFYINTKGFDDIKIVRKLNYTFKLRIALTKDMPKEILDILDKTLSYISRDELNAIYSKWIKASPKMHIVEKYSDISIFDILPIKQILIVSLLIIIIAYFLIKFLQRKKDINLGFPIFIFVLIFLIASMFVTTLSVNNLEKVKKNEFAYSLNALLNTTYESIKKILYSQNELLNVILENTNGSQNDIKMKLSDMKNYTNIVNNYVILDKNYNIVDSTYNNIGKVVNNQYLIKSIKRSIKFNTTYLFPTKQLPKEFQSLLFIKTIYNDLREPKFIVIIGLNQKIIQAILNKGRIGNTGETYIINKQKELVSNSRFIENMKKRGILRRDQNAILNITVDTLASNKVILNKNSVNTIGYNDYRKTLVFGAWKWDKDLNIGLISEIDKSEAMKSFDRSKSTIYYTFFAIATFIILLTVFVLWFVNRSKKALEKFNLSLENLVKERTLELDNGRKFTESIISSSQDALIVINRHSIVTTWNRSASVIFGYKEDEIIGQNIEKIIPQKYRALHHTGVNRVSSNGEQHLLGKGAIEIEAICKNGNIIDIDLVLNSFIIDNEMFFSANIRDVTERKKLTKALNSEKKLISSIINSQDSIVVTSNGKVLTTINNAFKKFYNLESIDEFTKKYGPCICDSFEEDVGEEYLKKYMGDRLWVQYILDHPHEIHKVIIKRGDKPHIFSLSLDSFIFENEKFITVVLNDITEVENAKKQIESIHRHTRESIEYASLIQGALIPDAHSMEPYFKDHFVTWIPKDTVGGDIWLFNELRHRDECLLLFIDCTGHGVPGAFVTMIVKAIEREIISKINKHPEFDISPALIMGYFNKTMKTLLKQETKDSLSNAGFDGGIIYYNKRTQILKFCGAETPLFYITKDGQFNTIKGNRYSVGYKKCDASYVYKEHTIQVEEGMKFFCTTDGYLDQNGGEKDFPFGKKRFGNIIKEYYKESMANLQLIFQTQMIEYELAVENNERNDDITLIGFEIGSKSSFKELTKEEIVKYEGVMTQNVIAAAMDNIDAKINNMNFVTTISTITIEYCQNMMNYSKNKIIGDRQIVPAGEIEVQYLNEEYYEIMATNIVSIDDKEKIEPKLKEIQSLDRAGIKKRYKELRKSGENTHGKGGGIGMYEIAKVSENIEYKFKPINEDKFYFTMKSVVKPKRREKVVS